jgi:hypothetical protein
MSQSIDGRTYEYLPLALPKVAGPEFSATSFCEIQDELVRDTTCEEASTLVDS